MLTHVIKNNILNFLPQNFETEIEVNHERIHLIQDRDSSGDVIYIVTRSFRIEDNFAYNYACTNALENNSKLNLYLLLPNFDTEGKTDFFQNNLNTFEENLKNFGINYKKFENIDELYKELKTKNNSMIVTDFNPITTFKFPENLKVVEVDSFNIVPARFISDKQEYNAASLRHKIYYKIAEFLTGFPIIKHIPCEAENILQNFITKKLPYYAEYKNNPAEDVTSNLSKYINFGFISSQRIALEIIKADTDYINKEVFLEELIIRKELSDNFCLYNKKYKTFNGIPQWAKQTLKVHERDIRTNIFTLEELETARTYDELWNASQKQLLKDGKIHGYMRMYWAKKILEWTVSPEDALKYAVYLNDKYAFDAPSANGYVGILWAIGGLHDRAFAERTVTGKIRPMTYNGAKSKFDIKKYIETYN